MWSEEGVEVRAEMARIGPQQMLDEQLRWCRSVEIAVQYRKPCAYTRGIRKGSQSRRKGGVLMEGDSSNIS